MKNVKVMEQKARGVNDPYPKEETKSNGNCPKAEDTSRKAAEGLKALFIWKITHIDLD